MILVYFLYTIVYFSLDRFSVSLGIKYQNIIYIAVLNCFIIGREYQKSYLMNANATVYITHLILKKHQ